MPTIDQRLRALDDLPPEQRLPVLIEALDHAREDERAPISAALLASGRDDAVIAVVRQFHRLTPEARAALSETTCDVVPALHRIITAGGTHAATNALAMAAGREDVAMLPVVADVFDTPSTTLAAAAATVLEQSARRYAERPAVVDHDERTARRLDDAVARGLETYRLHRDRQVLRAAALQSSWAGPKLELILAIDDHPATMALRGVVESLDEPVIRRHALRWLTSPVLGRPALRWLHRLQSPASMDDLLDHGHLLLNPERRSRLRHVDRPMQCGPSPTALSALGVRASRDLVRWLDALPLDHRTRAKRAASVFAVAKRIPRLRVMPRLLAIDDVRRRETIDCAVRDGDPIVARCAQRHALRHAPSDRSTLAATVASDHPVIVLRSLMRTACAHIDGFRAAFDHLGPVRRRIAARSLLRSYGDDLVAYLRSSLHHDDAGRVTTIIILIRDLDLVPTFEPLLREHVMSSSSRCAASAVQALRQSAAQESLEAIRAALLHDDARVRSNAVESLVAVTRRARCGMLGDVARSWLEGLARDDHNRIRGNAVRALLRDDAPAAHRLVNAMLEDKRPLHRVSALWAARAAGSSFADVIAAIERDDAIPAIRARAGAVRAWLDAAGPHVEAEDAARR